MIAGGGWDLQSAPARVDACAFEILFITTFAHPPTPQRLQLVDNTYTFIIAPNEHIGTVDARSSPFITR